MRTVFVTGAGGFIGRYVVLEFIEQGWRVLAGIRRAPPPWLEALSRGAAVSLVRADLRDAGALAGGLAAAGCGRIHAIVHCAGRASDVGRRRAFFGANVLSVGHLVRLAIERDVPRLVFLSTTDVYGLRDFHGEAEDELPLGAYPANPYPESKIAAEALIRHGLPSSRRAILRLAQVWGVGDTTLTARIVGFLCWSPRIVHFGRWGGQNRWPLAHVRNVAAAAFVAACDPCPPADAVNVLDSEHTTMDSWYRLVAGVYLPGKRLGTVVLPMGMGKAVGWPVSAVANALNLDRPWLDPSWYALHAVAANLDFANGRFLALMRAGGRRAVTLDEGVEELRSARNRA